MGGIGWLALQGPREDRFDLRIADLARLSRTRFIEQAIDPLGVKALPPLAHRLKVNLHLPGHGGAAKPVRQTQDHTARKASPWAEVGRRAHPSKISRWAGVTTGTGSLGRLNMAVLLSC
jgi:hypothetical protein